MITMPITIRCDKAEKFGLNRCPTTLVIHVRIELTAKGKVVADRGFPMPDPPGWRVVRGMHHLCPEHIDEEI